MTSGVLFISGMRCPICDTIGMLDDGRWVAPGDVLMLICPIGHKVPWQVSRAPTAVEVKKV